MPYLQHEKTRLQGEVEAAATELSSLTAQLAAREQAVLAAQAQVGVAQTKLSDAQTQIPPLEAAAAAADQRAAEVNEQIEAHLANEPDQEIENPTPGKPPLPNPAWIQWSKRLDVLNQQSQAADAASAAAQGRLNSGRAAVSQTTAELQAAEGQVVAATAAVQVTQTAIAAARQRQEAAQAQLADLDRWNEEIARDPLARKTLEQVAAELSARAAALGDDYAKTRVENEIATEILAALTARRDQLVPALNDVNGRLPAASQELAVAQAAVDDLTQSIRALVRRGPRP